MKYTTLLLIAVLTFLCLPSHAAAVSPKNSKIPVIVIDPGHGGKDTGASRGGVSEKNLNLDIAAVGIKAR